MLFLLSTHLIVHLVIGILAQMSGRTFLNTKCESKTVLRLRGVKAGQVQDCQLVCRDWEGGSG